MKKYADQPRDEFTMQERIEAFAEHCRQVELSEQALDQAARNRPAHEIRLGSIKATIWARQSEHGTRYSVHLGRIYKTAEGWKTSTSFDRDDLLLLAKVVDRAHTWLYEHQD